MDIFELIMSLHVILSACVYLYGLYYVIKFHNFLMNNETLDESQGVRKFHLKCSRCAQVENWMVHKSDNIQRNSVPLQGLLKLEHSLWPNLSTTGALVWSRQCSACALQHL